MARSVSGERIEKVPLHDIRNEIFQHYSPITNPIKDPIKDTLVPLQTNFDANGSVRWRTSVYLNLFHWSMGKNSGNRNGVGRHCGFLEHWNSQKVFVTFDNIFHAYLMSWLKKNAKKKIFTVAFFLNPLYPFWDAHGQAG